MNKPDQNVLEALKELRDLMEDVIAGEYTPDSFTCQPANRAIEQSEQSLTTQVHANMSNYIARLESVLTDEQRDEASRGAARQLWSPLREYKRAEAYKAAAEEAEDELIEGQGDETGRSFVRKLKAARALEKDHNETI